MATSALKIHACAAPDDGDGDLVDGGLHDDGDGDLVDGDTVDDDINCDISDVFYLTVISPLLGSGCTVGGTASAMRMMMTVVIIKMMEGARSTFFWQQNKKYFFLPFFVVVENTSHQMDHDSEAGDQQNPTTFPKT